MAILVTLIALPHMTLQDIIVCILAFMPTGWGMLLVSKTFIFFSVAFIYKLRFYMCIAFYLPLSWSSLWFVCFPINFQIAQACKPLVVRAGFWGSVRTLARGYEIVMGLLLFTPVAFLAWFPFVSEFQTRMLFNQAFSRGLQISRILGGQRKDRTSRNKEWSTDRD